MQVRIGGRLSSSNAEPMSTIFALPVRLIMMFEGFMSPWTMPSRCSAASAARQSRMMAMAMPGLSRGWTGPAVTITSLMYFHRRLLTPLADVVEHPVVQQPVQVVAVDPFHLHHADAVAVDPVVDVQQVVLLDLGDVGGDLGDAAHRLVVGALVLVGLGREDLEGHRQREVVGAPTLGEIDDPLPARAQPANQPVVLGPTETFLVDDRLVSGEKLVRAFAVGVATPGPGGAAFGKHRC